MKRAGAVLVVALAACRSFPPPPSGFSAATLERIAADETWRRFALEQGAAIYVSECARCHGDSREGEPGYPSLADEQWVWGASAAEIADVVRHGVRVAGSERGEFAPGTKHGPEQTSPVTMLAFEEVLTPQQIDDVASFTERMIAGSPADATMPRGAEVFAAVCASCHGQEGEGRPTMGFPRLRAAGVQIERRDARAIRKLVRRGIDARTMKAFAGRLEEDEIRCVALYVSESARADATGDE